MFCVRLLVGFETPYLKGMDTIELKKKKYFSIFIICNAYF